MSASTIAQFLAVRKINKDEYESLYNPERMGNTAPIAYGGCTVGIAVAAAYQTIRPGFHAYSMLGHYLGPAMVDRKLFATVRRVRDTKTFSTRSVEVSQVLDDGSRRVCVTMLADFQIQEPKDLLNYSTPPSRKWEHWSKALTTDQVKDKFVAEGKLTKDVAEGFKRLFGLKARYFDERVCQNSLFKQVFNGILKHLPTTQDHLPLTERISADWFKTKEKFEKESENVSSLAFIMDAALSFLPLTHNHLFLDDAGACSSLDFALRVFDNHVDIGNWHLREMRTTTAREGRTYSAARIWDEQGKMVAEMTQQSILRTKPGSEKVVSKM
jgi:acyl-CoA thioesterase II